MYAEEGGDSGHEHTKICSFFLENGQNYTNFDSNLTMMAIYLPVKFEFDWTKPFRVRVRKREC